MKDELSDRYGSLPISAVNLLNIALIKSIAHKIGIMEIKGGIDHSSAPASWCTVMKIYAKAEFKAEKIDEFINCYGGAVRFVTSQEPGFIWRVTKKKFSNAQEYLTGLKNLLNDMQNQINE